MPLTLPRRAFLGEFTINLSGVNTADGVLPAPSAQFSDLEIVLPGIRSASITTVSLDLRRLGTGSMIPTSYPALPALTDYIANLRTWRGRNPSFQVASGNFLSWAADLYSHSGAANGIGATALAVSDGPDTLRVSCNIGTFSANVTGRVWALLP